MPGVFAGLIVGVATAMFLMLGHWDPLFGWSAGFLALCVNFVVTVLMSLLTPISADNGHGSADFIIGTSLRVSR